MKRYLSSYRQPLTLILAAGIALSGCSDSTSPDRDPPIPGASGLLSFVQVQGDSCRVVWSPASDDASEQAVLSYRVVRSSRPDIITVTDAQTNGTLVMDWTEDTYAALERGLEGLTRYYFNVLVRDEAENTAAYVMAELRSADSIPPVPGGTGAISKVDSSFTRLSLSWVAASDISTAPDEILYSVVYSTQPDIETVSDALANGVVSMGWRNGVVTEWTVEGLLPETEYHFNVLIRDDAGNLACYVMETGRTLHETVIWGREWDMFATSLDGSGERYLFPSSGSCWGLAVDPVRHMAYWTLPSQDEIRRADLIHGGTLLFRAASEPIDVEIDVEEGMVYWSTRYWGISASQTDGSDQRQVVSPGPLFGGIALDLRARQLYWASGHDSTIYRAGMDGSAVGVFLKRNTAPPREAAVDTLESKIYWLEISGDVGSLHRCNLDGSVIETLVAHSAGHDIGDFVLDTKYRKLYWISADTGLWWSDLDGSNPQNIRSTTEGLTIGLHQYR